MTKSIIHKTLNNQTTGGRLIIPRLLSIHAHFSRSTVKLHRSTAKCVNVYAKVEPRLGGASVARKMVSALETISRRQILSLFGRTVCVSELPHKKFGQLSDM